MDQTLEIAVQNAKSLASNIRLTLIIWSIFAAIITAFLGLWQHKVNKQAEKLSAERDAEKARINKEAEIQKIFESQLNYSIWLTRLKLFFKRIFHLK